MKPLRMSSLAPSAFPAERQKLQTQQSLQHSQKLFRTEIDLPTKFAIADRSTICLNFLDYRQVATRAKENFVTKPTISLQCSICAANPTFFVEMT